MAKRKSQTRRRNKKAGSSPVRSSGSLGKLSPFLPDKPDERQRSLATVDAPSSSAPSPYQQIDEDIASRKLDGAPDTSEVGSTEYDPLSINNSAVKRYAVRLKITPETFVEFLKSKGISSAEDFSTQAMEANKTHEEFYNDNLTMLEKAKSVSGTMLKRAKSVSGRLLGRSSPALSDRSSSALSDRSSSALSDRSSSKSSGGSSARSSVDSHLSLTSEKVGGRRRTKRRQHKGGKKSKKNKKRQSKGGKKRQHKGGKKSNKRSKRRH